MAFGIISDEGAKAEIINPNTLGIVNVLCTTVLLQLFLMKQSKKTDYVCVLLLVTIGALTASRTYLVCLLLMVFLLICGYHGNARKKTRLVVTLVVFALVALLLLNLFFPSILEYYIGRFQVEDLSAGRGDLMADYHQYIVSNGDVMFFGHGLSNLDEKLVNIYAVSIGVPHNNIQEIILAWGIPGLLFVGLLIYVIIAESRRYGTHRKSLLNYAPLIIILVKSLAGQMLTSGYTMLALVLAYLSLCQNLNTASVSDNPDYNQEVSLSDYNNI